MRKAMIDADRTAMEALEKEVALEQVISGPDTTVDWAGEDKLTDDSGHVGAASESSSCSSLEPLTPLDVRPASDEDTPISFFFDLRV